MKNFSSTIDLLLLTRIVIVVLSPDRMIGQNVPVTVENDNTKFELAKSLTKEADELSSKGDNDSLKMAEEKYLGTLNICHRLGDGACVRYAQFRIGRIAKDLHDFEKAGQFFEQALDLKNEPLDRLDVATIRSNLAKIYVALGIHNKADEHFQITVSLLNPTESWEFLGFAFTDLAELGSKQSNIEQSIKYFTEALEAFRRAKYLVGQVVTLSKIGDLHLAKSRYDRARAAYEEASNITKSDRDAELWIQNKLCSVEKIQGNSSAAIRCYSAVAAKARIANDQSPLRLALHEIGVLHRTLGQYPVFRVCGTRCAAGRWRRRSRSVDSPGASPYRLNSLARSFSNPPQRRSPRRTPDDPSGQQRGRSSSPPP